MNSDRTNEQEIKDAETIEFIRACIRSYKETGGRDDLPAKYLILSPEDADMFFQILAKWGNHSLSFLKRAIEDGTDTFTYQGLIVQKDIRVMSGHCLVSSVYNDEIFMNYKGKKAEEFYERGR